MREVELIGKHIIDARYADGNIYLNMEDGKTVALEPYGDCCAHCYIENVSGSEALQDATVESIQDLDVPLSDDDVNDDSTVTNAWGHRVLTSKGICNIEMRVVHNGYYGGSLEARVIDGTSQAPLLEDF